ncbi:MAG TPA: hypothetical protein VK644_10660 [Chitinophagaceae bacterium]|nr:hypothetical protein [Chitinophagaceae bacterium]
MNSLAANPAAVTIAGSRNFTPWCVSPRTSRNKLFRYASTAL